MSKLFNLNTVGCGAGACDNATLKDYNEKFTSPNGPNLILSKKFKLGMAVNNYSNGNVLVVGGPGTGRTRYYVRPNILQKNASYIVTDPGREMYDSTAAEMMKAGYKVRLLDVNDPENSHYYNPFAYIRSDSDVPLLVKCIVPVSRDETDKVFVKKETELLMALMLYVWHEHADEEKTLTAVSELLDREVESFSDPDERILKPLFEEYAKKDPTAEAVRAFNNARTTTGDVYRAVVISAATRMKLFAHIPIKELMSTDTMNLEGLIKCDDVTPREIIYVVPTFDDDGRNIILSMLYTQAVNLIYAAGERRSDSARPFVHMFLYEAELYRIPQLDLVMSTSRKYGLSWSVMARSLESFSQVYKNWGTIVANCTAELFFGNCASRTLEYVADRFNGEHYRSGEETKLQADELRILPNSKCLVTVSRGGSFIDDKYSADICPRSFDISGIGEKLKENAGIIAGGAVAIAAVAAILHRKKK